MTMYLGAGTIQQGDITGDVMDLQKILAGQGYEVAIDGNFGPQTATAVRAFQSAHGLVPDGIVGPDTWAVLNGNTPQPIFGPPVPIPIPVTSTGPVFGPPVPIQAKPGASVFSGFSIASIPPMAWYAVGGLAVLAFLTGGKSTGRRKRR